MIRTVLEAYRDHLFTDLFPGREWVPKTLIFAKDDAHAESIVAREVFGRGNDFVKKITYRVSEDPKGLVKAFRVDPLPRIVVTVDMIATGTDVKPIEVLIFLRDVKSELYYEQMKGRGVRSIDPSDLKQVTPDAEAKTRFVLVDAVGVSESHKTAVQPLERKRNVGFEKLMDQVAAGLRDDDSLSSLAGRLAALDHRIGDDDRGRIKEASGGTSLHDLAAGLLDAIDPERVDQEVERAQGTHAADEQRDEVRALLKDAACAPLDLAPLRNLLKEIKRRSEIVIDEISRDELRHVGYDFERARETTRRFRDFLDENRDELLALQILYGRPQKEVRLTYAAIRELADRLTSPPWHLTTAVVWEAYRRLEADKVRGAGAERLLTDIIALVRFATGQVEVLEPFPAQVEQRFNLWVGRQIRAGREFTDEQMTWLQLIKAHIAANAEVGARDLMEIPTFTDKGGLVRARMLFGEELNPILNDLNEALVA
jgi:type I restriction enzyme R subunit